jgi:hypothetical protein
MEMTVPLLNNQTKEILHGKHTRTLTISEEEEIYCRQVYFQSFSLQESMSNDPDFGRMGKNYLRKSFERNLVDFPLSVFRSDLKAKVNKDNPTGIN